MKSNSEAPLSEDCKDISEMILQDNQKSEQNMKKEVEKDEEITLKKS